MKFLGSLNIFSFAEFTLPIQIGLPFVAIVVNPLYLGIPFFSFSDPTCIAILASGRYFLTPCNYVPSFGCPRDIGAFIIFTHFTFLYNFIKFDLLYFFQKKTSPKEGLCNFVLCTKRSSSVAE